MTRTHSQAELAEAMGINIDVIKAGDNAAETLTKE